MQLSSALRELNTRFCKTMEYLPGEDQFIVRAAVGWSARDTRTGADLDSPTGYAFQTGEPVISSHLEHEGRFRTPQILLEHEIKRAINVPIITIRSRYGILEADSPIKGKFTEADVAFMQGFANLLGVALERGEGEETLLAPRSATVSRPGYQRCDLGLGSRRQPVLSWNEALTTLFGYAEAETDGSWWKDHIHPEDRERVERGIQSVISGAHETWSTEYRFLRADGSAAYVFDRGFVIRDDQGRAIRMIGSMLDLTERRQAEARRLASSRRLPSAWRPRSASVGRALQAERRTVPDPGTLPGGRLRRGGLGTDIQRSSEDPHGRGTRAGDPASPPAR